MKGVGCQKPLVLQCFLGPTPLIEGVKVHPLNQGGMGCQGSWEVLLERLSSWRRFLVQKTHSDAQRRRGSSWKSRPRLLVSIDRNKCFSQRLHLRKGQPHIWETGGILFREYCFGEENSLGSAVNLVSSATNSVSSCLHTNNRLRRAHWVRSPKLSEPRKTHRVRCLKPYSLSGLRSPNRATLHCFNVSSNPLLFD